MFTRRNLVRCRCHGRPEGLGQLGNLGGVGGKIPLEKNISFIKLLNL